MPGRRLFAKRGNGDGERLLLRTPAGASRGRGVLTRQDPWPMVQRLGVSAASADDAAVQRQSLAPVPKYQLCKDLFLLRGVSDIQPKDPVVTPDEDDRPKFWALDFDALVDDDDSPLGRAIAEQKRIKQIYTGKDDDTQLGLSLSIAGLNILTSTPPGQDFLDKLHIKNVTIVLDPSQRNYGLSLKFKLNCL